jgi:hypothetical protein
MKDVYSLLSARLRRPVVCWSSQASEGGQFVCYRSEGTHGGRLDDVTSRHVMSRHVTTQQHPAPAQPDHSRCTARSRYKSGPNLLPFKCSFTCKCDIKYSFVIRITIIITPCAPLHMISVSLLQGSAGLLYHAIFTPYNIRVTTCTTCLSIKILKFCFRVVLTISSDLFPT